MAGPLDDLLVLDLSSALTGPYATMLLGDLGARVVKVEQPGRGDATRGWGPPFAAPRVPGAAPESTYYLSANRNKESIALDLRDAADREVLEALVRRADVVVENFRPGVLERLGLGHQRLQELNPRAVVLSITGFGHDGPEAHRTGYDQIAQGEGGLMSVTGAPGDPQKVGVPISDLLAGMFGALGAVAALRERDRTGLGTVVRTSLLAAVVAVHVHHGTRWLVAGEVPHSAGNQHGSIVPYGAYPCADGLVQVCVGSEALWRRFAPLVGVDPDDSRFDGNARRVANREALDAAMAPALRGRTRAEWLRVLAEHGVPAGDVRTIDEVYASPQVAAQDLVVEVEHPTLGTIRLPGAPLRFDGRPRPEHLPPPTLDQHGEAIRAWLTGSGEQP